MRGTRKMWRQEQTNCSRAFAARFVKCQEACQERWQQTGKGKATEEFEFEFSELGRRRKSMHVHSSLQESEEKT